MIVSKLVFSKTKKSAKYHLQCCSLNLRWKKSRHRCKCQTDSLRFPRRLWKNASATKMERPFRKRQYWQFWDQLPRPWWIRKVRSSLNFEFYKSALESNSNMTIRGEMLIGSRKMSSFLHHPSTKTLKKPTINSCLVPGHSPADLGSAERKEKAWKKSSALHQRSKKLPIVYSFIFHLKAISFIFCKICFLRINLSYFLFTSLLVPNLL